MLPTENKTQYAALLDRLEHLHLHVRCGICQGWVCRGILRNTLICGSALVADIFMLLFQRGASGLCLYQGSVNRVLLFEGWVWGVVTYFG